MEERSPTLSFIKPQPRVVGVTTWPPNNRSMPTSLKTELTKLLTSWCAEEYEDIQPHHPKPSTTVSRKETNPCNQNCHDLMICATSVTLRTPTPAATAIMNWNRASAQQREVNRAHIQVNKMQNKNGKRRIKKFAKLQAIRWMYQSLQDSNSRSHVIAECDYH